jgi:hypothetical protein
VSKPLTWFGINVRVTRLPQFSSIFFFTTVFLSLVQSVPLQCASPASLASPSSYPFLHLLSSTSPLESVHSDVWTSPVPSLSRCKYYVVFVDEFSWFSWLYPLFNKSDVLSCFIKFKLLVENLFDTKIKYLQSDNGGEYTSTAFKQFLNQNGIFHRLTCPHTSKQNGIAERKHRYILETELSLLA